MNETEREESADAQPDTSSTAGGLFGTPGSSFGNPQQDSGSNEMGGPDPGDDDAFLNDNYPPVDTSLSDAYHAGGPDSAGVGSPGMGGMGMGRGTDLGGSPNLTGFDTAPGSYGSGGSSEQ